jgi:hypothetical protein
LSQVECDPQSDTITSTDGGTKERTEFDGSTRDGGATPEGVGVAPPPPRRPRSEAAARGFVDEDREPVDDETVLDVLAAWRLLETRPEVASLAAELENDGWTALDVGAVAEALQQSEGPRWRVRLRDVLLHPSSRQRAYTALHGLPRGAPRRRKKQAPRPPAHQTDDPPDFLGSIDVI